LRNDSAHGQHEGPFFQIVFPTRGDRLVAVVLYAAAAVKFPDFRSAQVFLNFFNDNSVLGFAAIGLTFVILSGGIDLSVGAVVALTSIGVAVCVQKWHWNPVAAILVCVTVGGLFGLMQGVIIDFFRLPAFLVTLGGMFLARGLAFLMQLESVPLENDFFLKVSDWRITFGAEASLPLAGCLLIGLTLIALVLAHFTSFGRNVYALGGNEQSAVLMGLPTRFTRVFVYALSGLCAAGAGVVYTIYTVSGNPNAATGLELDAIAAVVIGGTLLSGGVGYVAGTFLGVLIFGIIQTAIIFLNLNSWWTKIVVGGLLLLFLLIQKVIQAKTVRQTH
jgi:galactofuranose transport system permease protein